MTDNEIVKALKCCLNDSCYTSECFFFKETKDGEHCQTTAIKYALDLINRQKAEIERFKKIETTVNAFWSEMQKLATFKKKRNPTLEELLEYMDNLKAEVIKEFVERLKENCKVIGAPLITNRIDNLVKEMVGDTE